MSQCPQESLRVTAALLEALGVPQQVGLPAEVCLARLMDVDAFLSRGGHSPQPPDAERALNEQKVIAHLLRIMDCYHEQEACGIDTPGGLEHMGDVWGLFLRWEAMLRPPAADSPGATGGAK